MWFDKQDKDRNHKAVQREEGIRCGRCRGTGKVLEIAIGLGNQTLVPAYVEVTCPKCRGDGVVTPREKQEWGELMDQKITGVPENGIIIYLDHEFIFPDSFFIEKMLKSIFSKKKS